MCAHYLIGENRGAVSYSINRGFPLQRNPRLTVISYLNRGAVPLLKNQDLSIIQKIINVIGSI